MYIQGLNFLIVFFSHKNKVFTSLRNWEKVFGCDVCLVNFFFICCFHQVYFCLEGGTFKSYNSRAIDTIPIKIGQSLD